jgi:hypothetical protein
MSEAEMKDLIHRLQRTNRRWKILALISTSFLALLFLATGVSSVVHWKRVEAEREMALRMQHEAMVQRNRNEQLRQEAPEAVKAAEKALKAEENAINKVDGAKKKDQ